MTSSHDKSAEMDICGIFYEIVSMNLNEYRDYGTDR